MFSSLLKKKIASEDQLDGRIEQSICENQRNIFQNTNSEIAKLQVALCITNKCKWNSDSGLLVPGIK